MSTNKAWVTATLIGGKQAYTEVATMSTDLPADALGELVAMVINKAWRSGEDPKGKAVTLIFS